MFQLQKEILRIIQSFVLFSARVYIKMQISLRGSIYQGRYTELFTSTFTVWSCNNWTRDPNKSIVLKKLVSGISQSIPHPCNLVTKALSDCQSNAKKTRLFPSHFPLKIKHNCISVNRNKISLVKTKSLKCWRAHKLEVPWERENRFPRLKHIDLH